MAKATVKTEKKENSKAGKASQIFPGVLLRPCVTEKASKSAMEDNVYMFEVGVRATKRDIKKAVSDFYKVQAVKIAVLPIPSKDVSVRGKKGRTAKGKKAYIYLKKGDKIEFV